jgi:hypothetical protein
VVEAAVVLRRPLTAAAGAVQVEVFSYLLQQQLLLALAVESQPMVVTVVMLLPLLRFLPVAEEVAAEEPSISFIKR